MLEYNLATEYATLAVILVILISFIRDYESKTIRYKMLRLMYAIALTSSLATILSMEFGGPGEGITHKILQYAINVVYFALIPALTSCYLFFCMLISSTKSGKSSLRNSLICAFAPYVLYLVILFTNISNGKVFYVTETEGYVRGEWYQLPFYIAAANIVLILALIFSHKKVIHKETTLVISLNMGIAVIVLIMQAIHSQVIMTGLCNTLSILAVHLYTQNTRKSVDALTDTKNNLALRYKLGEFIRKEQDFSLYVFSLRGFKSINERNGLEFGDQVLAIIARQLKEFLPYEAIYRYSGDEFAVLLEKNENNEEIIQQILKQFAFPLDIEGIDTVQLDLVCARVDNKLFGNSMKELISAVDYSVSVLKQTHGEPRYLYDTAVVKQIIAKSKMIQQIKDAIDNRMFQVCYQPMYSVKTKEFTQAEALVRMKDGEGGLLSPASFIDVAETTGLVVPMTFVVLDIVCEDLRKLLDKYGEDQPLQSISVNFPYHLFLSPNMKSNVMEILKRHNIETSRIKIEITERTLISDENLTKEVMDSMREEGFVFELDDFGVDYSNMSTFLNLPLHIVKIDRSVLLSALETHINMQFFQHLVVGISVTGRIIIVEGVETREQLDFVIQSGCEFVQGYYFSKPLLFEDFEAFVHPVTQNQMIREHKLL